MDEISNYALQDVCVPQRPGYVIFPELRNASHSLSLCRRLRGRHAVVYNEKIQNELIKIFRETPTCSHLNGDGAIDGGGK